MALAELGKDAEALMVLDEARRITRELEAWRFDSENLTYMAEIYLGAGDVGAARSALETALDIARRAGMAYFGAITLATFARSEPDPQSRRKILDEIEELLSSFAVSHNHWLGRRQLIELGWELRDPDMIDGQASALESFCQREPSPLMDAVVGRGRALARALRGERSPDLAEEIARLKSIAATSGSALLKVGLEECENAMSR